MQIDFQGFNERLEQDFECQPSLNKSDSVQASTTDQNMFMSKHLEKHNEILIVWKFSYCW